MLLRRILECSSISGWVNAITARPVTSKKCPKHIHLHSIPRFLADFDFFSLNSLNDYLVDSQNSFCFMIKLFTFQQDAMYQLFIMLKQSNLNRNEGDLSPVKVWDQIRCGSRIKLHLDPVLNLAFGSGTLGHRQNHIWAGNQVASDTEYGFGQERKCIWVPGSILLVSRTESHLCP